MVLLSSLIADLEGHQRKIVMSEVRPAKASDGDAGIALDGNGSLDFLVTRAWNAPAGHYREAWYLVHPETREVLFGGSERNVKIWGLQSWTELTDTVTEPIRLEPGTYLVVFALGGVMGGQAEVEAKPRP